MEPVSMLTGISTAISLASKIKDKVGDQELKGTTAELLSIILDLQSDALTFNSAQSELVKKCDALEKKVLNFETWVEEKAKYTLTEISSGIFAYVSKPDSESAEPLHWLCPKCYNNNKKSILQRTEFNSKGTFYTCHECSSSICDSSHKQQLLERDLPFTPRGDMDSSPKMY